MSLSLSLSLLPYRLRTSFKPISYLNNVPKVGGKGCIMKGIVPLPRWAALHKNIIKSTYTISKYHFI